MRSAHVFGILAIALMAFLLFGCLDEGNGQNNKYTYKGITLSSDSVPEHCKNLEDCGMYECMVDQCWCSEIPPQSGVIYISSKKAADETDAEEVLVEYLNSAGIQYDADSIRAVKLNSIFYSTFYETNGQEEMLTVAIDGTVMATMCGV